VDACLDEVEGCAEYGTTPEQQVGGVLGKWAGARRDKKERVPNKSIGKVIAVFAALNRQVEWESYDNNDLPLLRLDDGVAEVCVREKLTRVRPRPCKNSRKPTRGSSTPAADDAESRHLPGQFQKAFRAHAVRQAGDVEPRQ
jgi:hypothetical protein